MTKTKIDNSTIKPGDTMWQFKIVNKYVLSVGHKTEQVQTISPVEITRITATRVYVGDNKYKYYKSRPFEYMPNDVEKWLDHPTALLFKTEQEARDYQKQLHDTKIINAKKRINMIVKGLKELDERLSKESIDEEEIKDMNTIISNMQNGIVDLNSKYGKDSDD